MAWVRRFRPTRRLLARLILLVAVPGSFVSLIAFGGRWLWSLDVAGNFRVQYLAVLAPCALALALLGQRRAAALAGVCALVNLALVAPLYVGRPAPAAGSAVHRVVYLNVLFGNQNYAAVRNLLRDTAPDIFVLAETSPAWEAELAGLRAAYPYTLIEQRDVCCWGTMVFSRRPFRSAHFEYPGDPRLAGGQFPTSLVQLDLDGRALTLIGFHPPNSFTSMANRVRDDQVRSVARLAAGQTGARILCGDLNTSSWSALFDELVQTSGLHDSRQGFGVQPTWVAANPLLALPLDHCLISDEVTVVDRWVGPDVGSDHRPVVLDFAVAAGR